MSSTRRDTLVAIESAVQAEWDAKQLHCWDAPAPGEPRPAKFFTTFPFPYMNGRLHLGHGFSLTKAEFASRFHRMKGLRSLWAFGFHATGTPIAACAQKIIKEMEEYGNPPTFPSKPSDSANEERASGNASPSDGPITTFKSKRGKTGPAMPQWRIMQAMGIPDAEIAKFADPYHWIGYFTPLAMADLRALGCHIDFRRSFVTTSVNPYFDRFVRWQFNKLREADLLHFDKRYCVYSPWDGQPCADHDRNSGEGVQPQEYTLVKLVVQSPLEHAAFAPFADRIGERAVVLPGATLRTETVMGQTNCWVNPNMRYSAYTVVNRTGCEEVFIMTARAARNMAYQGFVVSGATGVDPAPLFELSGEQLIGLPLSAPMSPFPTVYVLPMFTISEAKGSGIVMCVPSDSPDDYVNLMQLRRKPDYRAKLKLKDEWVMPFDVVPIIDIPGLGNVSARTTCEQLKIAGPNAKDELEEAKRRCYQDGFYKGVMLVGPYAGARVPEAKVKTLRLLLDRDEAVTYYEPMSQVISRSGDECVVALCDQWYLEYGKEEWKAMVREHLPRMNMFFPSVHKAFEEALNWLSEWPCSRTFGLGTYLPCDATHTMIIDSLSDSTIYMAYYTIARFFHTSADGTFALAGRRDNAYGLLPEMFTDAVFDHIFHGTGNADDVAASAAMPAAALRAMRNEFDYWYPVDLRCSGKDLIQNHLTEFLYNHAAIWPNDHGKWPRAIFCNGHIQVDGEKMAKSKGNFITLRQTIDMYGADATRLACADAGDSLDDANFVRETAAGFVLKLTTLLEQAKDMLQSTHTQQLRTGGEETYTQFDRIFVNIINSIITRTEAFYASMQFRMGLNTAFHEMTNEFSQYKMNCDDQHVHMDVVRRYYTTLTLMLMPLAPHIAEHMWQHVLGHKDSSVVTQSFPTPSAPLDYTLVVSNRVMTDVVKDIRALVARHAKKHSAVQNVVIYTRAQFAEWQNKALDLLQSIYEVHNGTFPSDLTKYIMSSRPEWLTKELVPDTMAFLSFVRANVDKYGELAMSKQPVIDDQALLMGVTHNLCKLAAVQSIEVLSCDDDTYAEHSVARRKCRPGEPTVALLVAKRQQQQQPQQ